MPLVVKGETDVRPNWRRGAFKHLHGTSRIVSDPGKLVQFGGGDGRRTFQECGLVGAKVRRWVMLSGWHRMPGW